MRVKHACSFAPFYPVLCCTARGREKVGSLLATSIGTGLPACKGQAPPAHPLLSLRTPGHSIEGWVGIFDYQSDWLGLIIVLPNPALRGGVWVFS